MSQKVASNLDLLFNQLLNFVVQNLASDPVPVRPAGHLYYNTANNEFRFSDGTSYLPLAGSMTGADILQALLPVDGAGTGLDADLLDGLEASAFALAAHTHTASQITDFTTEVQTIVNQVIDGAPGALDTLNELAAALGDDPNFATTITNLVNTKTAKASNTIGDGSATSYSFVHNLGTEDVHVQIRQTVGNKEIVLACTRIIDGNTVQIDFGTAPSLDEYTVTVIG